MSSAEKPDVRPKPPNLDLDGPRDPDALRFFSRSPHPYAFHRAGNGKVQPDSEAQAASTASPSPHESANEAYNSVAANGTLRPTPNGRGSNWTPGLLKTPSESGTEADDEGYGFGLVRALPPAPLRLHKGLRRSSSDERREKRRRSGECDSFGTSPYLTPSQLLDDEPRAEHRGKDYFDTRSGAAGLRRQSLRGSSANRKDEESRAARERTRRKRRAEIARRVVEFVLSGCIGVAVVGERSVRSQMVMWQRETGSRVIMLQLLFAMYPLRLLWYGFKRRRSTRGILSSVRIPASFDPAPLFYPTTIPVLVAASLSPSSAKYLLPNAVLCIAAVPAQLIPWSYGSGISNSLHWMLSMVPLLLSENTAVPSRLAATKPYRLKMADVGALEPETIACLYPLHHALLVPLQFVTSTSLLPAELQLLSVALINLLLFSTSPQAVVLNILLWFGGLSLFVTCGPVVRWGIALARIPKWRLKRAGRIIGVQQSFIASLNKALREKSGVSGAAVHGPHSSDSEDGDGELPAPKPRSRLQSLRQDLLGAIKTNFLSAKDCEIKSATESRATGADRLAPANLQSARKRSHTLPNPNRATSTYDALDAPKRKRSKRSQSSIVKYFLSLTPQQASARKWYYASYVWVMVLAIIFGPAWYLVSRYALDGHEPLGWAISYVFGNVPSIRFATVKYNLESWIPLPPLEGIPGETPLSYRFPRLLWWIRPLISMLGLSPGPATTRLLLVLYCGVCVLVGLTTVILLSPFIEVDTRRKVFHFTMVALLLPSVSVDPCFISLALALVLAAFLLLELLRASQLPPLSKPIATFLAPYVDGRDYKGPVVVSHIFLLIGCAIPLWLSLAGARRSASPPEDPWKGWSTPERNLSMLSGVICVGLGDAFASLVGRRFGRHKWPWAGGKSLEGSFAFACAVVGGLIVGRGLLNLVLYGHLIVRTAQGAVVTVAKAFAAGVGASMMETVLTGGNDNVIVPVVLWLLVRAVGL